MSEAALALTHVTRTFGRTIAVEDVSLRIEAGALVGLLGRNGAGKTTLINMSTGLLPPSEGTIEVLGLDVERESLAVKRRIGVMPQDDSLLEYLTGRQFLQFVGRVYGLSEADIDTRSRELFETLDFVDGAHTFVRDCSYGMKKKLALAAALIHAPEILFLDEPFEGIDPVTSRAIRDILATLRQRGVTIVMSSHVLETVERLCSSVVIIDRGRVLASGTLDDLRERHGRFDDLEEFFVRLIGEQRRGELSWI